jgi:tellurite resistance protein
MGLFDKIFSSPAPTNWEPSSSIEAWACCLYALGHVDGDFSEVELDEYTRALVETRPFQGVDLTSLLRPMIAELKTSSWPDLCMKAASRVGREHAETAFCMACELAMRDGDTTTEERSALERLASAMSLAPDRAQMIVETFVARYKFQHQIA